MNWQQRQQANRDAIRHAEYQTTRRRQDFALKQQFEKGSYRAALRKFWALEWRVKYMLFMVAGGGIGATYFRAPHQLNRALYLCRDGGYYALMTAAPITVGLYGFGIWRWLQYKVGFGLYYMTMLGIGGCAAATRVNSLSHGSEYMKLAMIVSWVFGGVGLVVGAIRWIIRRSKKRNARPELEPA